MLELKFEGHREKDQNGSHFEDDIYFNDRIGRTPPKFTIQTTSFGALEEGEYKEFLDAQHIALEVVTTLDDRFLNK